jgi:hypothetical protein
VGPSWRVPTRTASSGPDDEPATSPAGRPGPGVWTVVDSAGSRVWDLVFTVGSRGAAREGKVGYSQAHLRSSLGGHDSRTRDRMGVRIRQQCCASDIRLPLGRSGGLAVVVPSVCGECGFPDLCGTQARRGHRPGAPSAGLCRYQPRPNPQVRSAASLSAPLRDPRQMSGPKQGPHGQILKQRRARASQSAARAPRSPGGPIHPSHHTAIKA